MSSATVARVIAAAHPAGLLPVDVQDGRQVVLQGSQPLLLVTVTIDLDTSDAVLSRVTVPLAPLLAPPDPLEEELRLALLISGTLPEGRCILRRLPNELLLQGDVHVAPERFPWAVTTQALLLQRQALRLAPAFALVGRGLSAIAALASLDETLDPEAIMAAAERILSRQKRLR